MVTRADAITQSYKKVETYSDFSNNFTKHPVTNELVLLKNEDSVRQAVKNVILTSINERYFNPFFGSNVNRVLFENFDPFVLEDLRTYINLALNNFEPRVKLVNVTILDNSDKNALSISIVFSIINNPNLQKVSIFLKRVR
jgi:phage baseplate assembly protein W